MNKKGFTLLELIISITICVILASIVFPALKAKIPKGTHQNAVNVIKQKINEVNDSYYVIKVIDDHEYILFNTGAAVHKANCKGFHINGN